MIGYNEIVTMTTISLCKMSNPSFKFFGVCSKFLDVSLFRPNLFIKDDLRMRGCHFGFWSLLIPCLCLTIYLFFFFFQVFGNPVSGEKER